MALRQLTSNLVGRPSRDFVNNKLGVRAKNLQEYNAQQAFSSRTKIQQSTDTTVIGEITVSDSSLQIRYEDWVKDVNSMPSVYHTIGERYSIPYSVSRAIEDTVRYKEFLKTKEGILFLIKQFGLQLSQPKTRLVTLQGTRIFNPVQFGLNIPGAAIGGHFPRHGLIGLDIDYEKITSNQDIYGNRLINIYYELGHDNSVKSIREQTKLGAFLNRVKNTINTVRNFFGTGYEGQTINELSGPAGPKSVFGVGWTDIRSYNTGIDPTLPNLPESFEPSTNKFDVDKKYVYLFSDSDFSDLAQYSEHLYTTLGHVPGNLVARLRKGISGGKQIESFEVQKYNTLTDRVANKPSRNYNSKEFEIPKIREDYGSISGGEFQTTNIFAKYKIAETRGIDGIYNPLSPDNNSVDDLIELKFTDVYSKEVLQFRATIMGFSTNFGPEWSEVNYIGRPDSVRIYKGVKRAATFSFMIAAQSKREMRSIYDKINMLSNLTTPRIKSGKMIGPLSRLKIGNLINNEIGYLSSLDFNVEDDYIWDVDEQYKVPMYIRVNVGFEIIGKKTPRHGVKYFGEKIPFEPPMQPLSSIGTPQIVSPVPNVNLRG